MVEHRIGLVPEVRVDPVDPDLRIGCDAEVGLGVADLRQLAEDEDIEADGPGDFAEASLEGVEIGNRQQRFEVVDRVAARPVRRLSNRLSHDNILRRS